jgi:nucleotide-binding universal stress UspA family protein
LVPDILDTENNLTKSVEIATISQPCGENRGIPVFPSLKRFHGGARMIPAAIPEIKKILYTTDLSKNARYAFGYAISLANRYNARISVLHVLEDDSRLADSLVMNIIREEKWKELRRNNEQDVIETIKERLQSFCDEVSRDLPECPFITDEVVVKIGNPADVILEQAESSSYDIVVVGAHGHGILGGAMMGSVSRRIVRRCKKPVLVIRLPIAED